MPARSVRRVPRFHCGLDFSRTGSGLPCPRRNDTRKYTEILCIFAWFRLHCVTRPVNHCVQSRSNVFSARFSTRGNIYYWQFTPRIVPCGNCPRNLKSLLVDHRDKLNSNAWFSHEIQPRVIVPRFGYSIRCPRVTARWLIARVPNFSALLPTHASLAQLLHRIRTLAQYAIVASCKYKLLVLWLEIDSIQTCVSNNCFACCVRVFLLSPSSFSPFLYTQIFMRV